MENHSAVGSAAAAIGVLAVFSALGGCAVITVADAAVSVAATTVSVAATVVETGVEVGASAVKAVVRSGD